MEQVKLLHVACALLSISGFVARGLLMLLDSHWLQARLVKIAPHVVDTVLLISAIVLASQWGWAALQMPWLLAKIIALLAYIGLGSVALRAGRPKVIRVSAWLGALLTVAYIVAVAVTKEPAVFI